MMVYFTGKPYDDSERDNKAPLNEMRMVLIGKTGSGKSKTGNNILSSNSAFKYSSSANSETSSCKWATANRFGYKIDVVDTPGVFDTSTTQTNDDIQKEIKRCIAMTTPGPHAILLCVKMGRFGEEDKKTLDHFLRYFGNELINYAFVIFTNVDQWLDDKKEQGGDHKEKLRYLDEYVNNLPTSLTDFLRKIGNRYSYLNNRLEGSENENQVKELIEKIYIMMKSNNTSFYTNKDYEETERILQEIMEKEKRSRDEVKTSPSFLEELFSALGNIVKATTGIITYPIKSLASKL